MYVVPPHNNSYSASIATTRREAALGLSDATPREVAYYAFRYVQSRIKDSVNLEILRNGTCAEGLRAQQRTMYQEAGTLGKSVNKFTSEDFINLTSSARKHSIGNCADICMLAARAIAEQGYPRPIELCAIQGQVENHSLDHSFLRIHCDPKAPHSQNYILDPFVQMLSQPEQNNLLGTNQPLAFEEPDFPQHLFCYTKNDITGNVQLLPVSAISNYWVRSVAAISLDSDRKLQFIPTLPQTP